MIKLTMLFRQHEETKDINKYVDFLHTDIIPNILNLNKVSHVELCHYVPFSFVPDKNLDDQKYILQLDIYYENQEAFQHSVASFNSAKLVEEIIKASEYQDIYISYITHYTKETYK
ncbi:hypothetical protein [Thermoflavimicrobium daqui]|nr:hypothetical protein [Thermoflavimicrobium daqui]